MTDNTPIYGCEGCSSTGGRMSCPTHGSNLQYCFPQIEKKPYKCPVCSGTGLVSYPPGFCVEYWSGGTAGPWTCRACNGSGVLWG